MLRAGTFNVQNLFDRVKILNLQSQAETNQLLDKVAKLRAELTKATYDKAKIESLLVDLKGYVTVRVDAGKFYKGNSKTKVKASGAGDWEGAIEFTRERFSDKTRENTAKTLKLLKADVLCMIEVEGRTAMSDFASEFSTGFNRNMLIDSPIDPRGIDVGLQWKKAGLGVIRSNVYDRNPQQPTKTIWSRDCLEVELLLKGGKTLHVLCNHFKSKMGGDPPEAQARRKAQATRASEILTTRYNLKTDNVILLGDLNDTPDSAPLKPLIDTPDLHDVFDVANLPAADRWTYFYKGNPVPQRRTQIDYVFVSKALKSKVQNVQIERRGMSAVAEGEIPGLSPFPGITGWKNAASDHAAITVDLDALDLP
jgi:endonuclease/exonuclease/phosphatase family metal-dependent hydrolase